MEQNPPPAKPKRQPRDKQVVIKNDESIDQIPEKLKVYVSEDIWSTWSPIRRESFKQIIKNPNSFFYRNRPPGDPQKFGPFTQQEEEQFIDRLNYFRHTLKVEDGLWGLFSVPIKGRLGYQCSNFYRQLIKEGKVQDSRYEVMEDGKLKFKHGAGTRNVDPEVLHSLEKEAFDFINECLAADGGNAPKIVAPIRVEGDRPGKERKKSSASESLMNLRGRRRKLAERRFNPSIDTQTSGAKTGGILRRGADGKLCFADSEERRCPLYGALDPMSMEPMTVPMMDSNGFVMDLKSWRRVFRQGAAPPCEPVAMCEGDLVELNAANFNDLRLYIMNIAC